MTAMAAVEAAAAPAPASARQQQPQQQEQQQQKQQLPRTTAETTLRRLLQRCEARVAAAVSDDELLWDAKLHTFVAVLREQLSALSGDALYRADDLLRTRDGSHSQHHPVSPRLLHHYSQRIDALTLRLGGHIQWDLWHPPTRDELRLGSGACRCDSDSDSDSDDGGMGNGSSPRSALFGVDACRRGRRGGVQAMEDGERYWMVDPEPVHAHPSRPARRERKQAVSATTTDAEAAASAALLSPRGGRAAGGRHGTRTHDSASARAADLRRRRRGGGGTAGNVAGTGTSGQSSLSLSGSARALLEQHRDLQDELSSDMLTLAQQLKQNSVAMDQRVRDSNKLLDSSADSLDANVATIRRANQRASAVYSRGWCTSCWMWAAMVVMLGAFVGMVAFMKVT